MTKPLPLAAAVAAAFLTVGVAAAMYIKPEIEKVPVDRLVENLEKIAKDEPKNADVRFNLARVHGMAYALKTDTAEIRKGKEGLGAWFGFEPAFVPYKAQATEDKDKQEAARKHLEKAIASFKEAIALAPDNLAAKLGLAWSTEQSGDKEAAIKAYREVIAEGWKKEKDLKAGPLGGHYITVEAAGYLIPLLDKEKDKDEIKMLEEWSAQLKKLPRPVTPIAVPLRDGLKASDLEDKTARVAFDADGSGLKKEWTWITKDAGWLVYDPKGRGDVTSGLQLFGGVSFWLFWDNGYDALASPDDDGDGVLTGKELKGLAIWQDANGDGIADPGEVRPLADWGVTAVSCRFERDATHPDRIAWSKRGVVFRDGTSRPTFDIVLRPAKR